MRLAKDRSVHVGDEAHEALDVESRPIMGALEAYDDKPFCRGNHRLLAQGARSEEGIILGLRSVTQLGETH